MGREVFAPGDRMFNRWHRNEVGLLASYLGIGDHATGGYTVKEAKRIYRCPRLTAGPTLGQRSSLYSNGSFDYAMFQAMGGARVPGMRGKSRIRLNHNGGVVEVDAKTPILVEEDPGWWLNFGRHMEPQHGNIDMLGSHVRY